MTEGDNNETTVKKHLHSAWNTDIFWYVLISIDIFWYIFKEPSQRLEHRYILIAASEGAASVAAW